MTTFVLVHGGWHGGWCWGALTAKLRAAGHTVFAPTLTGLAERAHLIDTVTGPDVHVDDIANVILFHNLRDVTLVGHSYGGLIISAVASRMANRIAHLVYLDAFVPTRSGQPATEMSNPERAAEITAAAAAAGKAHIPPSGFHRWASDPKTVEWLKSKTTPQPRGCFGKGATWQGDPFAVKRLSFVLAAQHQPSPFQQFYERYKSDPKWQVHSMDCLHDIMVERPDELAHLLMR
jgi:pimeloyl-ACP methyl ester carboxylesterase